MVQRDILPHRRRSETFDMQFGGQNNVFNVTVGFYPDGRIGEVFIDGAKAGSEMAGIARDGAVLMSMALQHGVPMEVIRGAISRGFNNEPSTIIGAVLDRIVEEYNG